MPDGLPRQVEGFLRQHVPAHSRLTLGYSGGLDSSVLLHLLADLRRQHGFSLSALHVHHGLSSNADAWVAHCQRECTRLDVPLTVVHASVRLAGEGVEAAARAARYQAFAVLDTDFVLLAHHRDDQAETVLLQLLRGGGLKGLAAMPASRPLGSTPIMLLRPLLGATRAQLAAYAETFALAWVEDESNAQTHLTRNALRHDLLPPLEGRFSGASQALARAAAQFAEVTALLDDLADLDDAGCRSSKYLGIAQLAALPEARARNLLRRHIEQQGGTVRHDALCEALRQLLYADRSAQLRVDVGGVSLRRFQGQARFIDNVPPPRRTADAGADEFLERAWRGEACIDLGGLGSLHFCASTGGGVRLPESSVTIRHRQGGERLRPDASRPVRTLKNLLRESAMPAWQRERLPLIYVDGRLAWAAGLGSDAAFQAAEDEPGWLISWQPLR